MNESKTFGALDDSLMAGHSNENWLSSFRVMHGCNENSFQSVSTSGERRSGVRVLPRSRTF
jgi:hypothetical protein